MKHFKKKQKKQEKQDNWHLHVCPTTPQEYKYLQDKANFKVGDKVLVTRKAKDFEGSWHNGWADGMNKYIGLVHEIVFVPEHAGGIGLKAPQSDLRQFWFPFFVLNKVPK